MDNNPFKGSGGEGGGSSELPDDSKPSGDETPAEAQQTGGNDPGAQVPQSPAMGQHPDSESQLGPALGGDEDGRERAQGKGGDDAQPQPPRPSSRKRKGK